MDEQTKKQTIAKRIVDHFIPSEADDVDDVKELSPELLECTRQERVFIQYYLQGNSGAQAAHLAGYGARDGSSTRQNLSRIARRLLTRDRVQTAMLQLAKKEIRTLGPLAITAAREIVQNPSHKDRAKVALNLIERVDPTVTRVEGNITHTHKLDHDTEAVNQLRSLKALGVARDKLVEVFGAMGLERYESLLAIEDQKNNPQAEPIEAEYTEITDQSSEGNDDEEIMRELGL